MAKGELLGIMLGGFFCGRAVKAMEKEGVRRAIYVGMAGALALFVIFVVKTHWEFEEVCSFHTSERDPIAYDDGRSRLLAKKPTLLDWVKKFFDEELVVLKCEKYCGGDDEYYYGRNNEKIWYKQVDCSGVKPSIGTIIGHQSLVVMKYLVIFLFVVVLPIYGFMWVKKGFAKN